MILFCSRNTTPPAGGISQLSGAHSGCRLKKAAWIIWEVTFEVFAWRSDTVFGFISFYPFVNAGSTEAAEEPVDHLNGTQDHLQAACDHQGSKQPNVKLHNVLRLCAQLPQWVVSQIFVISLEGGGKKKELYTIYDMESARMSFESNLLVFKWRAP